MTRICAVVAALAGLAALLISRRGARDASRWVALLGVVVRAGHNMNRLGTDAVLENVVAAVGEMGFESANISIIEEATGTYRVIHAHGMPPAYVAAVHPATIGMTGLVRARQATVAVADYGDQAAAVPVLSQAGFMSAVASPIWVAGELAGVLIGGSKRHRRLRPEEIEAFELLATHAGVALANAKRYEELERSRAQIRHQSHHDALTGLADRLPFRERIEVALAVRAGALLYVDLDGFKAVNDELGHAAGDQLLVILAERLRRGLRPDDIAARLGGDEFGVLVAGVNPADAEATARRLHDALTEPVVLDGHTLVTGASVGVVSIATSFAVDVDQLLREADEAMYRDKRRWDGVSRGDGGRGLRVRPGQ